MNNENKILRFLYTNWKGETDKREVLPIEIRFACTPHITEPEWLLIAHDNEKDAERHFVIRHIKEMR